MPLLARLVGRPGWHVYMSFDDDEPAGAGVFFVDGDLAYFSFGATVPKFRGRGGQSAILHARVQAALDLGHPIVADDPNSPARLAIQEMARKIASDELPDDHVPARPRGLFGRLWGRGSRSGGAPVADPTA